jgi:iron-sulfur cluster assembly accessory protein
METITAPPVQFTETAIAEIRKLMAADGFNANQFLRVGVKGGGCSGMTYVLAFDEKEANDDVFEIEGISCVMNKAHGIYVTGMQVDWQNGLNNRGFSFINPNAATTCGCGTSFGI